MLVLEGIHGLNDKLTECVARPQKYRIFISALSQLAIDDHNRIFTSDARLIRRIVRDSLFRGFAAERTLEMWEMVRQGEARWIFPFQEQADVMFNSALPFELNALKPLALQALESVTTPELRREATRLRSLLAAVLPLPAEWTERHVCPTSIFREFVGGSLLIH